MTKKIRVVITDDHEIYREAACAVLETDPRLEIAGTCSGGAETLELAGRLIPDIILMDIQMSPMNGIETTRRITQDFPAVRVIGFSIETGSGIVEKMLAADARGYVTKTSPREEILEAIQKVYEGKKYICREIREKQGKQ